jgi:hypothetical protein
VTAMSTSLSWVEYETALCDLWKAVWLRRASIHLRLSLMEWLERALLVWL